MKLPSPHSFTLRLMVCAAALQCVPAALLAETLELTPMADNTIFEESVNLSNGAGPRLYSGVTQRGNIRRALLRFDLSGIPAGATINSASLRLTLDRAPVQTVSQNQQATLHRLTAGWGEGSANPGIDGGRGAPAGGEDATWSLRFANTQESWGTDGGDFVGTASATTHVSIPDDYTWTSANMVSDIEAWLADPASNHGWILIVNETRNSTARRFHSRESSTASGLPLLTIDFTPGAGKSAYTLWREEHFSAGQLEDPTFSGPSADPDNDGVGNLREYAHNLNPLGQNAQNFAPQGTFVTGSISFVFRKNTAAEDLTYIVEATNNLGDGAWTLLAEIPGDGPPSGPGFIIESPVAGEADTSLVEVRDVLAPVDADRRFVRLRIEQEAGD